MPAGNGAASSLPAHPRKSMKSAPSDPRRFRPAGHRLRWRRHHVATAATPKGQRRHRQVFASLNAWPGPPHADASSSDSVEKDRHPSQRARRTVAVEATDKPGNMAENEFAPGSIFCPRSPGCRQIRRSRPADSLDLCSKAKEGILGKTRGPPVTKG